MAVGSERGLFDIPLWEHRYIKWWPIACGMMAPESSGRHSSPAEIDLSIFFHHTEGEQEQILSSSWAKNKYQIHPRVIENGQKN